MYRTDTRLNGTILELPKIHVDQSARRISANLAVAFDSFQVTDSRNYTEFAVRVRQNIKSYRDNSSQAIQKTQNIQSTEGGAYDLLLIL